MHFTNVNLFKNPLEHGRIPKWSESTYISPNPAIKWPTLDHCARTRTKPTQNGALNFVATSAIGRDQFLPATTYLPLEILTSPTFLHKMERSSASTYNHPRTADVGVWHEKGERRRRIGLKFERKTLRSGGQSATHAFKRVDAHG